MRSLEDAGKNGWSVADFSVIDGSGRPIEPQQIGSDIYARTDRYAPCHPRLHTVEPDYSGAWLDQDGIMLTVTHSVSDESRFRVLTIIEDVSGDPQCSPDPFDRHWRHTYCTAVRRRHFDNCFATAPFAVPWPYFSARCRTTYGTCRYDLSYSFSNTSLASHIARSLSNPACLGYDGKATASTREC
ncbi:hypothetical protein TNCV_3983131 [Trichonephila clavipes]|nr:hypothetical protein TNCV_3983131 [Trichonephila clavipes]